MRRRLLWLAAGLFVTSTLAAEPQAPTVDLLLYLAEWEPDAAGRLTDPLEIPLEADEAAQPSYVDSAPRAPSTTEYPR